VESRQQGQGQQQGGYSKFYNFYFELCKRLHQRMKEDITRFKFRKVEDSEEASVRRARKRAKSLSEVKELPSEDTPMVSEAAEESAEEELVEEAESMSDAEMQSVNSFTR
jgi:rRNA maturation endonuclease Nob1